MQPLRIQMTTPNRILRACAAICFILLGVLWAVLGLLLLAAALRGQGSFGEHGTAGKILLVVLWIGGMFAFFGAAVRTVRPALQALAVEMERTRGKRK